SSRRNFFRVGIQNGITSDKSVANGLWQWRRGPGAGTDVTRDFAGERIDFVEIPFLQQPEDQCRRKGIARADGVNNLNRNRSAIGPSILLIEKAARRASSQGNQFQTKPLSQLFDLVSCRTGQYETFRKNPQLAVIQLEDIGEAQRLFDGNE